MTNQSEDLVTLEPNQTVGRYSTPEIVAAYTLSEEPSSGPDQSVTTFQNDHRIAALLEEFEDVIAASNQQLGCTDVEEHEIRTKRQPKTRSYSQGFAASFGHYLRHSLIAERQQSRFETFSWDYARTSINTARQNAAKFPRRRQREHEEPRGV